MDFYIVFPFILKYVVLGVCGIGLWIWYYMITRTEEELSEMGVNLKGE